MAKLLILALLSAVFLTGQICSGLIDKHLCKYKKEDNVLSKRSDLCASRDSRCRRIFGWLPWRRRKPKPKPKPKPKDYYLDCCPGWTGKGPLGCQKRTCITLPQKVNVLLCPIVRHLGLNEQKKFYKLTTPPTEPLAYPNQTTNLLEAVPFPLLNQPSAKVVLRSALRPDLDEQSWLIRYLSMAQRNKVLVKKTLKSRNYQPFTNYLDYAELLKSFRDEQSKSIVSFTLPGTKKTFNAISFDKYMKYPSQELPFKDIITNEAWQNDDVFTQQRLAGLNPMSLRKMKSIDFNQDFVNKNYDWDLAIQRASGEQTATFSRMIDADRVFIIDYKLLHGLSNVEDYTERNTTDRREMEESRSPFCTFVVVNVGGGKELKPVAIQTDLTKDAPVFSPVDGLKWLKAKMEVQRADLFYVELIEHLLKTHLLMEPICVIMRRTLSVFHPLHQILKWHCRGLFVTNSLGLGALLNEGEFLHKLFAIGHVGAVELLKRAYPDLSWADTKFDKNLERRGVHKVEELPYFPYRDDGLLIWKNVGDFARDYVKLYYLKDLDVILDSELNNFAKQLSLDGTGTNGGIGMLKGFPTKILTRSQLIDVLKRIVFIPVQHHSVNYPVVYYAGFVPNQPSKLYDDPRVPPRQFGFDTLPQAHVAAEQLALSMSLGSIRYDVLLDYGKHLKDDRARAVVNKYHQRLIGTINDEITVRNNKRLSNGKMSYPYFLPKWMPNSIHT